MVDVPVEPDPPPAPKAMQPPPTPRWVKVFGVVVAVVVLLFLVLHVTGMAPTHTSMHR